MSSVTKFLARLIWLWGQRNAKWMRLGLYVGEQYYEYTVLLPDRPDAEARLWTRLDKAV